ncbi:MAG: glycosyl transferase [Acidobacteria bacterium]|nr:MAG: glycosyl transferase [Acidobacteriota bacterium]
MVIFAAAIKLLLLGLTIAALAYYLLSILAAARFFSQTGRITDSQSLPVTIMIPLCGADAGAYENYATFCRQDYSEYQIVFGVRDPQDSSIPIIQKLMADFPARDIELVICPETIGQNLKVSNLQNMLGRVKHEQIVIVDSDVRVGKDYLRIVVPPLGEEKVGLVTCLYRVAEASSAASILEAIGITAEFQPGVLVARLLEGMRFALGATMATKKKVLQSIGGFQVIADYLADDFMLGNLIWKAGYEVSLSSYVAQTVQGPLKFVSMIRHQIRLARGIRASRPRAYLGLILTNGTTLAVLYAIVSSASALSFLLLGSTLAVRLTMSWLIGVRWLGDEILRKYIWLVPARDILSFFIWCLGIAGKKVEWRGGRFELLDDGKMVRVS